MAEGTTTKRGRFIQVHGEDGRGFITKYQDFDFKHIKDMLEFTQYLITSEETKQVIIKKFEEK